MKEENIEEKNEEMVKGEKKNYRTIAYWILGLSGVLIVFIIVLAVIVINVTRENNMSSSIKSNYYTNSNTTNSNRKYRKPLILKPIIYIYPTEETDVEVKLGNPQYLSCTYPKYEEAWRVTAKPNGDLVYKETGRNLYALYWEGENIPKETSMQEGFCIKGENTANFLEEKLAILGLTDREVEEFIVYWLPKMEGNNYNYIRFETMEEQNEAMPLEITPKPDNIIRVMMDWKGLDEKIEVEEQSLSTPSREGYTVVEWGGSKLN